MLSIAIITAIGSRRACGYIIWSTIASNRPRDLGITGVTGSEGVPLMAVKGSVVVALGVSVVVTTRRRCIEIQPFPASVGSVEADVEARMTGAAVEVVVVVVLIVVVVVVVETFKRLPINCVSASKLSW